MEDWEGEDVWLGALPPSARPPTRALTASSTHNQLRPGITAVPGIISVALPRSFGTHPVQPLDHSSCPLALPRQTTTLSS